MHEDRTQGDETLGTGEFAVHAAPCEGGGTAVTVFGELDLATAEPVHRALKDAIDADGEVVIDLRACGFVDSSGIAVLAAAAVRLKDAGRKLVIRGVRERIRRTFEIAGLDSQDSIVLEAVPEPGSAAR